MIKKLFLFLKKQFNSNIEAENQQDLSTINKAEMSERETEKIHKAQVALNLANELMGQGEINEALKYYNESININPDCGSSYFYRGNALAVKENIDEAIADYEKAIDLGLTWAENYALLGKALEKIGKKQEATKMYIQALALKPEQQEWYTALYLNLQTYMEQPKGLHETALSLYAEY